MKTGGCFCGSVRYAVSGSPLFLCVCHCTSCRRATGVPGVPWGTFADTNFTVLSGSLAIHESSRGVHRGFCRDCGTALTYAKATRPGEIDITLGSLDEPGTWPPAMHIWVRDKLPWVAIGDDLPQWSTTPET